MSCFTITSWATFSTGVFHSTEASSIGVVCSLWKRWMAKSRVMSPSLSRLARLSERWFGSSRGVPVSSSLSPASASSPRKPSFAGVSWNLTASEPHLIGARLDQIFSSV